MLYYSKVKNEKRKQRRMSARFRLSRKPTIEEKVRLLIHTEPNWGPILSACLSVFSEHAAKRKRTDEVNGIAGAWIMGRLRGAGITPPNNLRTLSSLGLLTLVSKSRSGNRAYYTIPDSKRIKKALTDLRK